MLLTMMGVNNFGKIQSNPNNSYKYSNKGYKNCSSNLRKTKIWHPKPLSNLWQVHAKEHIQTRAKLQEIPRVSTFNELLDDCMISPEEKTLMQMHYLQNKDFRYIGDMLGYSEVTMKRWHHRVLKKINKLL